MGWANRPLFPHSVLLLMTPLLLFPTTASPYNPYPPTDSEHAVFPWGKPGGPQRPCHQFLSLCVKFSFLLLFLKKSEGREESPTNRFRLRPPRRRVEKPRGRRRRTRERGKTFFFTRDEVSSVSPPPPFLHLETFHQKRLFCSPGDADSPPPPPNHLFGTRRSPSASGGECGGLRRPPKKKALAAQEKGAVRTDVAEGGEEGKNSFISINGERGKKGD